MQPEIASKHKNISFQKLDECLPIRETKVQLIE